MFAITLTIFLSAIWISWFVWRNNRQFFVLRDLSETKFYCFLTLWLVAVTFFAHENIFAVSILLFLPVLSGKIREQSEFFRQNSLIDEHLLRLLDHLLMNMKCGKAFRPSLEQASSEIPPGLLKNQVQNLLCELQMNNKRTFQEPWVDTIYKELRQVDSLPHQAIAMLMSWRARKRLEYFFRRRSSQVAWQVRLQTIVVSFLYVMIWCWTDWQRVWRQMPLLAVSSLFLFLVGVIVIFTLGRRIKWNF